MANKWVYLFTEGNANMRELLGGKGANLAEMTGLGLPVPQGFTITTEACTQYYEDGREINAEIQAQINEYIEKMEEITGKKFGDKENPLLVSVRSGARASMPGMMDTILNLGLNEDVVEVIAKKSNNPRWAWDCYRRFIQMYSDVVMEVGKKYFEELIDQMKAKRGVKLDVELTADDLKELAKENIEAARNKLMDVLCNYQGFKNYPLILVFDAYRVEGHPEETFQYHNIHVVYTKEAETADQYIEKTTHEIGRKYKVTVATSDALEQVIVMGQGAYRISARDFYEEVERTEKQIREINERERGEKRNYLLDYTKEEDAREMEKVRLGKTTEK